MLRANVARLRYQLLDDHTRVILCDLADHSENYLESATITHDLITLVATSDSARENRDHYLLRDSRETRDAAALIVCCADRQYRACIVARLVKTSLNTIVVYYDSSDHESLF